jgi:UDP-glucose 6-dehydrogenase
MDVCIIGMGRVGLPLALSLEEHGLSVMGQDINDEMILQFSRGEMPFHEPGYDELVNKTKIKIYNPLTHREIPEADSYIITVGTPLGQHIETDLSAVKKVISSLIDNINLENKLIILRSTVAPHTTQYVKEILESKTGLKVGKNIFLAMCPERIVEGDAYNEFTKLPQIIGTEDDDSFYKAFEIFKVLRVPCYHASYVEAELAKLFCNIYRYINFAIPNYFMYLSNVFNVDVFHLFQIMNTDYPRNNGLKKPGFAAGTCLRGTRKLEYYEHGEPVIDTYENIFNKYGDTNPEVFEIKPEPEMSAKNSPSGTVNIENDIFVDGFSVNMVKDEKRKIKKITKSPYTGKMYKFHLENGKIFECTDNHLLPVIRDNKQILIKAKDIEEEDKVIIE